jgi:hypothetical protein
VTNATKQALASVLGRTVAIDIASLVTLIPGDATIDPLISTMYQLTKGSAAAIIVPAPGLAGIGTWITIIAGTNFPHVITFPNLYLFGVVNTTFTATDLGSSITFFGASATQWAVMNVNTGIIA